MAYTVGNVATVSVVFTDDTEAFADPTTVTLRVSRSTNTVLQYIYLVDLELIKDSVGHYHVDLDLITAGLWCFRWIGTGAVQAAVQDYFWVDAACV